MREQRGMSAEQLAGIVGISRQRIDALETGQLDPTYELLLELAAGLGIQLSALVAVAERLQEASGP
jgi:transcriptional regulator with XRE-family HTH domain